MVRIQIFLLTFAFTNPNWHSIEPRKFYELQIQASGSHGWRGYGSGVARPNKGLFVFGVQRRFLQEFAQEFWTCTFAQ